MTGPSPFRNGIACVGMTLYNWQPRFLYKLFSPRKATTLLRERLAADSVGLFGDRVHIVTREPETTVTRARQILSEGGFEVGNVGTVEPTLEDVFVSVLSGPPKG